MTDTSKSDPGDSKGSRKGNPKRGQYSDSSINQSSNTGEGAGQFHEGSAEAGVESRVRAKQLSDGGSAKDEALIDERVGSKADRSQDDQDIEGFSDDASADFSRDASFVLGKPKQVGSKLPPQEELERLDEEEPEPTEEVAQTNDDDSMSDLSRDQSMDVSEDSRHGIGKPQRLDVDPDGASANSPRWLTASTNEVGAASDRPAQGRDSIRPPAADAPAVVEELTSSGEETLNYDEDLLSESFFEGVSEESPATVLDDASQDILYDEKGEPKQVDSDSPDSGIIISNRVAVPAISPADASVDSSSGKRADEASGDQSIDSSHEPSVATSALQQAPAAPPVFDSRKPFFDPNAEDAPRLSDSATAHWFKAVWAVLNEGTFEAADLSRAKATTNELLTGVASVELTDALECLQRQLSELTTFSVAQANTAVSSTATVRTETPSPPSANNPVEPDVERLRFHAEDLEFEAGLATVDGNHLYAHRLYLDAAQIWREAGLLESAKSAVRIAARHQKRLEAIWNERHPNELENIGRTITKQANLLDDESRRQRQEQERERTAAIESQRQVIFSLLVTHEDVLAALSPTAQDGLSEKDRNDLAPEATELAQIRRRLESGEEVTLDMLRRDADSLNQILIAVLVRQRKSSKDARVQGQLEELGYGLSLPGPPKVEAQPAQAENAPRARQLFKDAYCRAFVSGRKGSVESSVRLFSTAVRQTPGEPLYRYFLGLSLYRNDEPQAGLEQVQIGAQMEKDQKTPPASVNHWLEDVEREQRDWLERIRRAVKKERNVGK